MATFRIGLGIGSQFAPNPSVSALGIAKGLVLRPRPPIGNIESTKDYDFKVEDSETEDATSYSDELGSPVYDNLLIPEGNYIDLDNNTVAYPGLAINSILLSISQSKNIIKTPIQGRNGTIKEYIADGDWEIMGSGTITVKDNIFPLDKLRNFIDIIKVPQQIKITNSHLNDVYNIDYIVFEDASISEIRGTRNQVQFNFTALSDFDIKLEEITNE